MAYESYPQIADPVLADPTPNEYVYKTQHTNLVQARDRTTGVKLASITETLSGLRLGDGHQHVEATDFIAPENALIRGFRYLDTVDRANAWGQWDIDLGQAVLMGSIGVRQSENGYPHTQAPIWITVWIDPGDGTWVEVLAESEYLDPDLYNQATCWVDCGERMVRKFRVKLRGVRDGGNRITLNTFLARPSILGRPWRSCDGLPLFNLPRYAYTDTRANVLPEDLVPYQNAAAWRATGAGGGGWWGKVGATEPAWQIVDLGRHIGVLGVHLHFTPQGYMSPDFLNEWDFGATIEVCNDAADVPTNWTVAWDSTSSLGSTYADLSGTLPVARWVRITNKTGTYATGRVDAGWADVGGQSGTGLGGCAAIQVHGSDPAAADPQPIAHVTLAEAGPLSLAICNADGLAIREPYAAVPLAAGSYDVYWDGINHGGGVTAAASLKVRAATSRIASPILFTVGNSGPPGDYPITGHVDQDVPSQVSCLALTPTDENILLASYADEGGHIFQYDADGHATLIESGQFTSHPYFANLRYMLAMAADDVDWFMVQYDASVIHLRRTPLATNATTTAAVVTTTSTELGYRATETQRRTWKVVNYLAVHPTLDHAYLSNYRNDRVSTWSKANLTETQTTALSVTDPMGVAVDPRGDHLWVAHSGNSISAHPINPDGTLGVAVATVTGLNDPAALACADLGTPETPDVRLVAVEFDGGQGGARLAEWDITTIETPVRGGAYDGMGTDHAPGLVSDTAWRRPEDVALHRNGDLWVADPYNHRALRFSRSDLSVLQRTGREYGPGAWVEPETIDHDAQTFLVFTGYLSYEVRLDGGTWTVAEGGVGPGTWRLHGNWRPLDDLGRGWSTGAYCYLQTCWLSPDGGAPRRYLYHCAGSGIYQTAFGMSIAADEPTGVRACAGVYASWRGTDDELASDLDANWIHVDSDGDGILDTDTEILEGPYTGDNPPSPFHAGGLVKFSVEPDGAILASAATPSNVPGSGYDYYETFASVCRIPIHDWVDHGDGRYSPIYRTQDIEVVVRPSHTPTPLGATAYAADMRRMAGGKIAGVISSDSVGWIGVWDRATDTRTMISPTTTYRGAHIIPYPDPSGDYVYEFQAGATAWHWGVVRDATTGIAVGMVGGYVHPWLSNWVDNVYGPVHAFVVAGKTYTLSEDNIRGDLLLHRVDGLGTESIVEAPLAWTGADAWDGSGAVSLTLSPASGEDPDPDPDAAPGPRRLGLRLRGLMAAHPASRTA